MIIIIALIASALLCPDSPHSPNSLIFLILRLLPSVFIRLHPTALASKLAYYLHTTVLPYPTTLHHELHSSLTYSSPITCCPDPLQHNITDPALLGLQPHTMPGILPMKVIKVGSAAQSRIAQACDRYVAQRHQQ
jgi:hypothetical protein